MAQPLREVSCWKLKMNVRLDLRFFSLEILRLKTIKERIIRKFLFFLYSRFHSRSWRAITALLKRTFNINDRTGTHVSWKKKERRLCCWVKNNRIKAQNRNETWRLNLKTKRMNIKKNPIKPSAVSCYINNEWRMKSSGRMKRKLYLHDVREINKNYILLSLFTFFETSFFFIVFLNKMFHELS